ncbi:hypothetical protein N431DRAFT_453217 [Stipitochalara longipes BDJ]|nr:hypothetical protein N431DRAFT_453217 [Stipitochalara longipes BDJ]
MRRALISTAIIRRMGIPANPDIRALLLVSGVVLALLPSAHYSVAVPPRGPTPVKAVGEEWSALDILLLADLELFLRAEACFVERKAEAGRTSHGSFSMLTKPFALLCFDGGNLLQNCALFLFRVRGHKKKNPLGPPPCHRAFRRPLLLASHHASRSGDP